MLPGSARRIRLMLCLIVIGGLLVPPGAWAIAPLASPISADESYAKVYSLSRLVATPMPSVPATRSYALSVTRTTGRKKP